MSAVPARPESVRPGRGATPIPVSKTVIGWQGLRFTLPPEWNVTGFSMDRDNGYLRVDAPGSSTMTVQVRWSNATTPAQRAPSLFDLVAGRIRPLLRRSPSPVGKTDLKARLETMLRDTAKQARKAKSAFESSIRTEKTEGDAGERSAINFSWNGNGRGQGKIWQCSACNRIVIAQVVGLAKDRGAISAVASQLFGSIRDHSDDGYDLWALYDAQMEVPSEFRLVEQKLLSGYLHLVFARGPERIVFDRWGLANMALKKFALHEWLENNAGLSLRRMTRTEELSGIGHAMARYSGRLPLLARLKILRESRGGLRRFPVRFEAGVWECPDTNKLTALQVMERRTPSDLWTEVLRRCRCHEHGGSAPKRGDETPGSA